MLNVLLTGLTIFSGVLVDPFPLAEAAAKHHQIMLSAAMAPDGHFAVAWVDSAYDSTWRPYRSRLDLYVRFFDKNGNPLTDAYKPEKIADTCWTFWPCIGMDSAGNTVLVWIDNRTTGADSENLSNIRFQRFSSVGMPLLSAKTIEPQLYLTSVKKTTSLGLNSEGEFTLAWSSWRDPSRFVWVQRFDPNGSPKNTAFMVHDSIPTRVDFLYPQVALNDANDIVITWLDFNETAHTYPIFQAFDADDIPILPWEPEGHRVDDGAELVGACAPKPFWLDNDRFVVFWTDYMIPPYMPDHLIGRVFEEKGLVRRPISGLIWSDSLWSQSTDPAGQFNIAVSSDDRFCHTHTRIYTEWTPDSNVKLWAHAAGILGKVQGNEPQRSTTLFEYTSAWGADTFIYRPFIPCQTPAVSVSNDRIVWVYSRMTRIGQDSVLKAYAMISDWDMGEGITEHPETSGLNSLSVTPIGSTITLRYFDCPNGFSASVFDASGRKIDMIESSGESGTLS
ncbi:hypothetical protein GX441_09050, partial [bacterium]|nr:hypothetical protein [bacterium]